MQQTFESETCGRCGGTGKHSFNQMDGDRCYGCGGTGRKLTARGAAARQMFRDSMRHRVGTLCVGDQIFDYIGIGGGRVWQTISAIEPDPANDGRVTVRLSRRGKETGSLGTHVDAELMAMTSPAARDEKMAAALAFQETLTKAGKPAKRVKAAA